MKFMVLIEPWGVYVKSFEFFLLQGGMKNAWGDKWEPLEADSIEGAREKGIEIRDLLNNKRKL